VLQLQGEAPGVSIGCRNINCINKNGLFSTDKRLDDRA